jgi:DNA-binding NtrC family response regulator
MQTTKQPLPFKVASRGSNKVASPTVRPTASGSSVPDQVVTVLATSPQPEDHVLLSDIFLRSNWKLHHAQTREQALEFLQSHRVGVIITECDLEERQCWRQFFDEVAALSLQPTPRFVVASRLADDQLWSEALNLGAYNVLAKPFDAQEVFWVVSHAWLDWKHDLEGRRAQAMSAH